MKRFHVHVAVTNLEDSVAFYSKMFGAEPTVLKPDYAKWMVEDPRLNFAISSRGRQPGVNHLGFQVDTEEELTGMRDQLAAADAGLVEEIGANCCYAKSDKYWVTDPQVSPGRPITAWAPFRCSVPTAGTRVRKRDAATAAACCAPSRQVAVPRFR